MALTGASQRHTLQTMKGQANLNRAARDPENAASGLTQASPLPVRSTRYSRLSDEQLRFAMRSASMAIDRTFESSDRRTRFQRENRRRHLWALEREADSRLPNFKYCGPESFGRKPDALPVGSKSQEEDTNGKTDTGA